jgi:predicted regulator of Ras-like GTPase activity (Roadblock/LC7/MglB family)
MEQLSNLIVSDTELAIIATLISRLMAETSAGYVMLLDKSGQVILTQGQAGIHDATTLGALLAGAFSSSRHVAELLGERDFKAIFQQGTQENIYTIMIDDQWLLVTVFDRATHLGLVKVLAKKAAEDLGRALARVRADSTRLKKSIINVQFRSSIEDTIDLLFRD